MVNDVAYESMNIPSFITSMVMKVLSSQIQSKVHFNILKLKPSEFAKTCSVPCMFIIGKEDKLVYPKRVQEIFNAYLGKQKSIINSSGDHSSEREEHIIKQCFNFVIQEFKRNAIHSRETIVPQLNYFDDRFNAELADISSNFVSNYEKSLREFGNKNAGLYHTHHGKFNFDVYLDESRNEENMIQYDENEFNEDLKRDYQFRKYASSKNNLADFSEEEILEDLTNLQFDTQTNKNSKEEFENHLNDLSVFMKKNHL